MENLFKQALKDLDSILKKRHNTDKIEEAVKKLNFDDPDTVQNLIKEQDLDDVAKRDVNTEIFDQIKSLFEKITII